VEEAEEVLVGDVVLVLTGGVVVTGVLPKSETISLRKPLLE
jgi:hypothetical protein